MVRKALKFIYFALVRLFYTERGFEQYKKEFLLVPDCTDIDIHTQYVRGNVIRLTKPMAAYCDELYSMITEKIKQKTAFSIIRASDGEAYFLQKIVRGNIPTRHFTKEATLESVDIAPFREGFLKNDVRLQEVYKRNRNRFLKVYGKNIFSDIPFEALYALMANRKLFQMPFHVGIIGSDKKIDVIQKLLKVPEYAEYIGRAEFEHYIPIPERGAANNPDEIVALIQGQLRSDIDVYLVGIGIAKLAVLHRLKESSNAVFVDAGAGISALAGMVNRERQYFAGWKNFALKGYDYTGVDKMDLDIKNDNIVWV